MVLIHKSAQGQAGHIRRGRSNDVRFVSIAGPSLRLLIAFSSNLTPVMNALLSSVSSVSLTEAEARSIAFLFAKCSDTLQIYGDDKAAFISAEAQQQMEKIAKPPTSENRNGDISVVFYSWSALPAGEVSKWTFLFRGNEVVSVKREPVSTNANEGSLISRREHALARVRPCCRSAEAAMNLRRE